MLHIGIVGLGGISQKAYLPFMRQFPDIHWHLFTRNQEVLAEVAELFGTVTTYGSLQALAAAPLDGVFIHTATIARFETTQAFLQKGIPVYMDKPLTERYAQTKELYDLAEAHSTFLMAGFNRRFAPKVLKMAEQVDKTRIYVEKNDVNQSGNFQFKLFDFFVHPLDTALFLTDQELLSGRYQFHKKDGQLYQVSVTLETAQSTILASMNLQSGSRREIMEVQISRATYHLENLENLSIFEGTKQTIEHFGSWDTTLYKRGFESIILAFIDAIKTNINPVTPESSLLSHWICQQINTAIENTGPLDLNLPKG
ncbi:gfo/Idh/MocA family oxidoreductase [Streptococcus sp. X16XC17]|uniref:Gfo/Idh/MocA family protein n=1 Tax=unclassified Streptococcus TaxID=2608887 RepID=UPI00066FE212|nr:MULTISPECIES: Gfo/Idh/MocA family oxidoreductase [unclassified Streptococcus]TCD45873.1 gfo/Idh/MocA family oxidoreductase [Streptococcus sp. X16XC17]